MVRKNRFRAATMAAATVLGIVLMVPGFARGDEKAKDSRDGQGGLRQAEDPEGHLEKQGLRGRAS